MAATYIHGTQPSEQVRLVGRRLFRLFRIAGLTQIELSVQPEVHWQGSPRFSAWIQNLAGNLESARHGLEASALCGQEKLGRAIAELADLSCRPDASSHFMWNRAMAIRGPRGSVDAFER